MSLDDFLENVGIDKFFLYQKNFPTTSNAMEFYKLQNGHLGIYKQCYHNYFMFPTNCQSTTCIYIY
jgi:hypothetical protein